MIFDYALKLILKVLRAVIEDLSSKPSVVLSSASAGALSRAAVQTIASSRTSGSNRNAASDRTLYRESRRLSRVFPDDIEIREDIAAAETVDDIELRLHCIGVAGLSIVDNVVEDVFDEALEVEHGVADSLADGEIIRGAIEGIWAGGVSGVWIVRIVAEPVGEGAELVWLVDGGVVSSVLGVRSEGREIAKVSLGTVQECVYCVHVVCPRKDGCRDVTRLWLSNSWEMIAFDDGV